MKRYFGKFLVFLYITTLLFVLAFSANAKPDIHNNLRDDSIYVQEITNSYSDFEEQTAKEKIVLADSNSATKSDSQNKFTPEALIIYSSIGFIIIIGVIVFISVHKNHED